MHLVERIGVNAPPGKEQAETDSLENTGERADGNGVKRAFFRNDLRDELINRYT